MQNQAAVEALYSATYVENYLETVENLPNELQTHISRLRELDQCLHKEFLRDLDGLVESFESDKSTAASQRAVLAKIQKGLIIAQDLGDDKLVTVQAITDLIENKTRHLEHDAKNLDFGNEDEEEDEEEAPPPVQRKEKTSHTNGAGHSGGKATSAGSAKKRTVNSGEDKEKIAAKRRKKAEKSSSSRHNIPDEEEETVPVVSTTSSGRVTSKSRSGISSSAALASASGSGPSASSAGASGTQSSNKKNTSKRKSGKRGGDRHEKDNDSDNEVDLVTDIDPDEPTYCLCEHVSYGDMIGCDNDLCPIEWFHFNCVSLTSKPKGKWFCPRCRGDKATTMKPKQVFLKELEKFNKEREEKMVKQNS